MATLLTKKSDTASSVPLAGDLTNAAGGAELAVNTADKKLYVKNSSGTVVELTGLKPTDIGVSVQAYDAELSTLAGMSSSRATYLASNEGFGFRNRIINGDMRIDQRNAGASVTPASGAYTLDRWSYVGTQASKFTAQQSSVVPSGFNNSLLLTVAAAVTVGASDIFTINQRIEGFNVADLGWGTAGAQSVTLSFWVRSSLTGTFGGVIRNGSANRSYPFTYSVSAANTYEYKTITVPGDTTGTWNTTNGNGIEVDFGLGVGSTFSGTAGAWAGNDFYSATGATSVVGTNGATFYITGVQLEAGSVATPFERRDYDDGMRQCERYTRKRSPVTGHSYATNGAQFMIEWAGMRSTPSYSWSGDLTISDDITYDKNATPTIVIVSSANGVSRVALQGWTGLTANAFHSVSGGSGSLLLVSEL